MEKVENQNVAWANVVVFTMLQTQNYVTLSRARSPVAYQAPIFFIHFVFYLFQWKQKHLVLHINKRVIYTRQPHFDVIQFCASRKLISILLANKVANPSVLLEIKLRKKIEFKKLLQCLRQKCKLDKLTSVRWRQHALLSNYHNSIQKFRRRCHESHRKRKFLY